MNTKSTQTFNLSEDDIKTAVREFIERKFGTGSPLIVDARVETVSVGYGMSEHDSHVVKVTAVRELT